MIARAPCPAALLAAALLSLTACAVASEALVDPMRPPAAYRDADAAAPAASPQPLVLQSIRISSARRSAVISGITVGPGERIGAATVRRIAEAEVVLEQEGVEQVLKLYPAVDKRTAQAAAPQPRTRASAARGGSP